LALSRCRCFHYTVCCWTSYWCFGYTANRDASLALFIRHRFIVRCVLDRLLRFR